MPITKNSDDYIDRIRKDFKDHYGVEITEKAVREILKQFQCSLNARHVMDRACIRQKQDMSGMTFFMIFGWHELV